MKCQRPNFFIVGAPKCGTTALHAYLRTHPNVFLCQPKEPNYFATDFPTQRYVTDERDYLRLFKDATTADSRVGEASAWYLYSKEAIPNIRRFEPEARVIAMVRNPLSMVPSLHGMLVRNFAEDEPDLEKAWDMQKARKAGRHLPKGRNRRFDVTTCLYADVCKLGAQIERVFATFPRDQVKVIVFDDFIKDTKACYEDVLRFLDLPPDGRTEFPPVNVRRSFKNRHMAWLSWKFRDAGAWVKRRLGIVRAFDVLSTLHRYNETPEDKPSLSAEFREQLRESFRPDIALLSSHLGRDLSWWLD